MFADPLSVTVNSVAKALIRINQDRYSSEYLLRTATEEFRLKIRNTSRIDKKRGNIEVDRHNVELVHTVFPVAPSTRSFVRNAYAVFENERGDTLLDPAYIVVALSGFLTQANALKLMNLES
jgi:hypothetical protein